MITIETVYIKKAIFFKKIVVILRAKPEEKANIFGIICLLGNDLLHTYIAYTTQVARLS